MNLTCLYLPPISANNKESIDLINFWKMAINRDRLVSVNVNLGEGYVGSFPENKITATLLTEEFSFQLCVYLFLKQKDIMLRRDIAKTYGAHFKYYWLLVSDQKFNWDFL